MSILDDIKAKLKTNEALDESLNNAFDNVYSCIRVWAAWSYDTMTTEDFVPFQKGDEAFDEFSTNLKNSLIKEKIDTPDKFYEIVEKHVSNYELHHNDDMDRNFHSNAFNQDFLGEIDLSAIYPAAKKYQDVHAPKEETPAVKLKTSKNKI